MKNEKNISVLILDQNCIFPQCIPSSLPCLNLSAEGQAWLHWILRQSAVQGIHRRNLASASGPSSCWTGCQFFWMELGLCCLCSLPGSQLGTCLKFLQTLSRSKHVPELIFLYWVYLNKIKLVYLLPSHSRCFTLLQARGYYISHNCIKGHSHILLS